MANDANYDPLAGWSAGHVDNSIDTTANMASTTTYEDAFQGHDRELVDLDLHDSPLKQQQQQQQQAPLSEHTSSGNSNSATGPLHEHRDTVLQSTGYSLPSAPPGAQVMSTLSSSSAGLAHYPPLAGPLSFGDTSSLTHAGPETTATFSTFDAESPTTSRAAAAAAGGAGLYPALPAAADMRGSGVPPTGAQSAAFLNSNTNTNGTATGHGISSSSTSGAISNKTSLPAYPQLSSVVGAASGLSQQQHTASPVVCVVGPAVRVGGGSGGSNSATAALGAVMLRDQAWVEYPITSHTSLPSWPAPVVTVHRRFRDFVALSDALAAALPGAFLPARPHRSALGSARATPRFLEARRTAMQRYLARLTAHPAACNSAVLQVFLQAQGPLASSPAWQLLRPAPPAGLLTATSRLFKQMVGKESGTPSPQEVTRPAGQSGDVARLVRERIARFKGATDAPTQVTPLEQQLRESGVAQEEVRVKLGVLATASSALLGRVEAHAEVMADLSKALRDLAQYEQTFGYASGGPEMAVAEGASRAGELASGHAGTLAATTQVVGEQADAIHMAQAALAAREAALLTHATLALEVGRKRAARDAAEAQGPQGFAKAQALGAQLSQLEVACNAAREQYSQLAERNASEMVAWRSGLKADLTHMVAAVCQLQISHAEAAQQLWSGVATRVQQVRLSHHAMP